MSTKLILDDATRRHEMRFELTLHEPFSLAIENQYFGGWPSLGLDQSALAMTFPVEGWLCWLLGPSVRKIGIFRIS